MAISDSYIKNLEEDLELVRKDAERYRWLRDNNWPEIVRNAVVLQQNVKWDEYIDAAIDAAIDGQNANQALRG